MSSPSSTINADLTLLRLIIREQQRQQERLFKVVRSWADARRLPSTTSLTPNRRDVGIYLRAASGFGRVASAEALSWSSSLPRYHLEPGKSLSSPSSVTSKPTDPFMICTSTAHKPLLAQIQDLRPNRSRPHTMSNSPLAPTATLRRLSPSAPANNQRAGEQRSVRFADIARTQISYYDGETEVTEDLAERFHAPFFIKLLFFILIFDLDMTLISMLAIVFALYIQGVFEPILRFFRPGPPPRRAPEGAARNGGGRPAAPGGAVPPPGRAPDPASSAATGTENGDNEVTLPDDENDGIPHGDSARESRGPPPPPQQHGRWSRALYQSIGVFVGTMLPWWTPDERYIV